MGWITRLKNGIAGFSAPSIQHSSGRDRQHRGPSLQLQDVRSMLEAAPGLSQPVWGPEISTVGAYSREGYTSKTFDSPAVPFRAQAQALQIDEDVQLAINHISSQVTGGSHYVKAKTDELVEYFEDFTRRLQFDIFDTDIVKELLWYGNSVYKPRLGIQHIRSADDLMHIPISSFVRIWWDRSRIPYKYEFRGAEYQGYHNPDEVIHFFWNKVNASAFGTGFGVSMTTTRLFEMPTPQGNVTKELPALLERKYATQFNMQMAEQRYITRNVWSADGASEDERNSLQASIENLEVGQDIVSGTKIEVTELGSQAKNFNSEQFTDITQGPIMKALNNFRSKESGSAQHSYANAETSAVLDEIGLSAFPIAVKTQLNEKLFKPWYIAHPMVEMSYLGGMIPVPWEETNFEIDFGEVEKKDIAVEETIKLIEIYQNSGMADPLELRQLLEQAGLGLKKSFDQQAEQMSNMGMMGMPQPQPVPQQPPAQENMNLPQHDIGGGPIYPDFTSGTTSPPNDMPIYNDMIQDVRGDLQNSYKRGNQSQPWDIGDYSA